MASSNPIRPPYIYFAKTSRYAVTPAKATQFSAGFDLSSPFPAVVPAGGVLVIPTHLQFELPHGTYGQIAGRSGLAMTHKIIVGGGVIDWDYRDDIKVILMNLGSENFQISAGDRIAQLIPTPVCYPTLVEVASLSSTARGTSGLGSSGMRPLVSDGASTSIGP